MAAPLIGILNKEAANNDLCHFANADFKHDFGHARIDSALKEVGISYDPACGLKIREYQTRFLNLKNQF